MLPSGDDGPDEALSGPGSEQTRSQLQADLAHERVARVTAEKQANKWRKTSAHSEKMACEKRDAAVQALRVEREMREAAEAEAQTARQDATESSERAAASDSRAAAGEATVAAHFTARMLAESALAGLRGNEDAILAASRNDKARADKACAQAAAALSRVQELESQLQQEQTARDGAASVLAATREEAKQAAAELAAATAARVAAEAALAAMSADRASRLVLPAASDSAAQALAQSQRTLAQARNDAEANCAAARHARLRADANARAVRHAYEELAAAKVAAKEAEVAAEVSAAMAQQATEAAGAIRRELADLRARLHEAEQRQGSAGTAPGAPTAAREPPRPLQQQAVGGERRSAARAMPPPALSAPAAPRATSHVLHRAPPAQATPPGAASEQSTPADTARPSGAAASGASGSKACTVCTHHLPLDEFYKPETPYCRSCNSIRAWGRVHGVNIPVLRAAVAQLGFTAVFNAYTQKRADVIKAASGAPQDSAGQVRADEAGVGDQASEAGRWAWAMGCALFA